MHISGPLKNWREEVGRRYLNLDFKPLKDDDPVHVSLDLHFAHDGVRLGRLKHSAGATFRDRELIDRDSDACFALLMPRIGALNVGHQGRSVDVAANDATLVHNCQPGHVGSAKASDFSALIIPEANLKPLGVDGANLIGSIWRKSNGALQLLKSYLACLAKGPPAASEAVRAAAARHVVELTVLAARDVIDLKAKSADEFEGVRAARLQIAVQHIREKISDPNLCVASIATSQGVSVRYMHTLFEAAGIQFVPYVNELRLQRVHAALADPDLVGRTIADIAFGAPPKTFR